jgi:hypothetical protein
LEVVECPRREIRRGLFCFNWFFKDRQRKSMNHEGTKGTKNGENKYPSKTILNQIFVPAFLGALCAFVVQTAFAFDFY